jgi:hypothetical protein
MPLLALKLVVTPVLIVGATLAGRRWGGAVSGWLVGLPLTSGPVSVFLALQHGRRFAAHAAVGSVAGVIGECAFFLAWGAVARRGWPVGVAVGTIVYAAFAAPVGAKAWPLLPLAGVALVVLVVSLRLLPAPPLVVRGGGVPTPRWDLPARAVVATALVLALTELASVLGARLTGLLAVYPLYSIVLAAFAEHVEGAGSALRVLRGVLIGLFAFVAFFLVVGLVLPHVSVAVGYVLAGVAAFVVQLASLRPVAAAAGRLDADEIAGA